jgi:hypothetical protein
MSPASWPLCKVPIGATRSRARAIVIVNRVPKARVSDAIRSAGQSQSVSAPAAMTAAVNPTRPDTASDTQPRRAPSSRPAMNVTSAAAIGPTMIQAAAVMFPLPRRDHR